ncbi:hypothetical protein K7432_011885 [Basidiobolus ranarum]|uniref:DUF7729 domain-containing protein n=1 Tax=Basidiobolus ranarum TaxID=34480 RepID=A0ABR2VT50_9FUNG
MKASTLAVVITSSLSIVSAAPLNPMDTGNLPLPSFKCLQVGLAVKLTNQDQGCIPVAQVVPLLKQIQQNPSSSQQQISEAVNDVCTAPTCTPDFLSKLQTDIQNNCQGDDAQNPYVQAATAIIRNYLPARDMLCLKDTTQNNYCSAEQVQKYVQDHPLNDTSNVQPPAPTKELCSTDCGKGWLDLYNKYSPQYPDLQQCPYINQLPTVCQSSL